MKFRFCRIWLESKPTQPSWENAGRMVMIDLWQQIEVFFLVKPTFVWKHPKNKCFSTYIIWHISICQAIIMKHNNLT